MPKLRQQQPKPVLYPGVTLSNSILYCNRGEWVSHFSLSLSLDLDFFFSALPFSTSQKSFSQPGHLLVTLFTSHRGTLNSS